MRLRSSLLSALAVLLLAAPPALATPVATSDGEYTGLGRVFPDPLANCEGGEEKSGCSPHAQGNVPATQFVGVDEFVDAMEYMNTSEAHPEWARFMEVLPLDGKKGDGAGTGLGDDAFPGNNLGSLEFEPNPRFKSAGLATSSGEKKHSDLYVVRVTDETVPDAGKKRYALSLSIHGIERAGVEGGTRAIEDLVTAATSPSASGEEGKTRLDDGILPGEFAAKGPTFRDALKKTIIYFTFPNPDGWRRGSLTAFPDGGGFFFQRYNGNGVDPNRDWPGVGYTFRPYSGLSEPESRAISSFFQQVKGTTGSQFAAGDDLHGQPEADALSYTLIPNASKTFAKNLRIRETSKLINKTAFEALKWSPIIQSNDQPRGGGPPCAPGALGDACAQIYAQTWGTVYDTINYTTTGALGDWFDSPIGLDADGIDNEMSFSHLDKNIVFEQQTEQLHVDGNKFLIFAHVAAIIDPALGSFDAAGRKGYVPNARLTREEKDFDLTAPPNTRPQDNETGTGVSDPVSGDVVIPFEVKRTAPTATEPGIYNGGLRADVRTSNVQGVGTGMATLAVQCRFCDDHPGVAPDDDGWVTVQEDFNQSFIYAQAGVTAAVNRPQAFNQTGRKVEWRVVISGVTFPGPVSLDVEFTSGSATTDGDAGGAAPSRLAGYDVANTDVFDTLNGAVPAGQEPFEKIDPRKVISGEQSLDGLSSLVLADDPLPGYTGPYSGDVPAPTGPPTKDVSYDAEGTTVPGGGSGAPGTFEDHEVVVGPNDGNESMSVKITWGSATDDFDLRVLRVVDGDEEQVASSAQGSTTEESVEIPRPAPGTYIVRVDNFAAADPSFHGDVTFKALPAGSGGTATGAYTAAERDAWFAKLRAYAEGGGNLVLTDGALRALPSLSSVAPASVTKTPVYAGQMTFAKSEDEADTTLEDPLTKDVAQPGARFNSGMRRQTYEPVPVGYAIQNASGGDASTAPQHQVARAAFEKAGGRVAATSADAEPDATAPVYDQVTLGEIAAGKGTIRIAGSLLPQPSNAYDHPFGLSPHGLTYTGYILVCNLLGADCSVRAGTTVDPPTPTDPTPTASPTASPTPTPAGGDLGGGDGAGDRPAGDGAGGDGAGGGGGNGGPAVRCVQRRGFRSVRVKPRGRGARLRFARRLARPVTVTVYQQSRGRRIKKSVVVARFRGRSKSVRWNGRPTIPGRRIRDGYYLVRFRMDTGAGEDRRRVTLRRRNGRFTVKRGTYRRNRSCGLLRFYSLSRSVFGGTVRPTNLRVAVRVSRAARVRVAVLRGTRVVRRFKARTVPAGRTVRLVVRRRGLRRGVYRIRLQVTAGTRRVTSTLISRKI